MILLQIHENSNRRLFTAEFVQLLSGIPLLELSPQRIAFPGSSIAGHLLYAGSFADAQDGVTGIELDVLLGLNTRAHETVAHLRDLIKHHAGLGDFFHVGHHGSYVAEAAQVLQKHHGADDEVVAR